MIEYFPPVFDSTRLLELALGDRELSRRLVEAFLRQLPGLRDELRQASSGEALFDVLHQIRGSCRFIAAERLADLLQGIEDSERARTLAPSLVVDTVLGELDDIEAALRQELEGQPAAPTVSAP